MNETKSADNATRKDAESKQQQKGAETPKALSDALTAAQGRLKRHSCGSAVVLHYQPGATLVWCHGCGRFVDGLPDWQPDAMVERFNTRPK